MVLSHSPANIVQWGHPPDLACAGVHSGIAHWLMQWGRHVEKRENTMGNNDMDMDMDMDNKNDMDMDMDMNDKNHEQEYIVTVEER
jgi:hypothetical protein